MGYSFSLVNTSLFLIIAMHRLLNTVFIVKHVSFVISRPSVDAVYDCAITSSLKTRDKRLPGTRTCAVFIGCYLLVVNVDKAIERRSNESFPLFLVD